MATLKTQATYRRPHRHIRSDFELNVSATGVLDSLDIAKYSHTINLKRHCDLRVNRVGMNLVLRL